MPDRISRAGCHEVVCPVGSSRRGKPPLDAFGVVLGEDGTAFVPEVLGTEGTAGVAGAAWGPTPGAVGLAAAAPGSTPPFVVRGNSGIGFSWGTSVGEGDAGRSDGVVPRVGGCVGCSGFGVGPGVTYVVPLCGVIGC